MNIKNIAHGQYISPEILDNCLILIRVMIFVDVERELSSSLSGFSQYDFLLFRLKMIQFYFVSHLYASRILFNQVR